MARGRRDRLHDAPLVRARRAAERKRATFLLVGALSLVTAAVLSGTTLAEWVKLGFITPGVITVALILGSGPAGRVVGDAQPRPAGVELALDAAAVRLEALHLAVLVAVWAGLVFVAEADGSLVMFAISAAHVVALTVLAFRLERVERCLDAPVYQRLRPGIWREPLWAYRDPDHGDPEIAAALGRSGRSGA